jgi:hypothetical protein
MNSGRTEQGGHGRHVAWDRVEVTDGSEWFLPESGKTLGYWLLLAFFGLGVLLWGLLFGFDIDQLARRQEMRVSDRTALPLLNSDTAS